MNIATRNARKMDSRPARDYWLAAVLRVWRNRLGRLCLLVLSLYALMLLAALLGWPGERWNREPGVSFANPAFMADAPNPQGQESRITTMHLPIDAESQAVDPLAARYGEVRERAKAYVQQETQARWTLPFGGDKWGRDIMIKTVRASQVSIAVGLGAALLALSIGVLLGAIGGFMGRRIGDALEWFYNVFTAMPYLLLVLAFAAVLGRGTGTVIVVLGLTGWTSTYRLIRSEYIKQRGLEYVQAADAIGVSRGQQMFGHILPNVSHLVLVQLSTLVVEFIKAEVVLSFLGLGVPVDSISWGVMIFEVQQELIQGKWWQLVAAVSAMSVFVVSFSLLADVLRDALDPKGWRT